MMKVRIGLRAVLATVLGLALWGVSADAAMAQQTGTVQGTVVEANTMRPLPGAQVTVQGTALGTLTDAQGRFQLVNVPAGTRTIRAQLIGHRVGSQEVLVPAGAAIQVSFTLEQTAVELEGVVVTALGIERQARAVGVAQQQISSEQITRVEPNVVNALSGRVSGVSITNAGPQGGSSRIVIRGASSITGNNQPLFIVDGVAIDNSGPRLRGAGGFDFGNAVQDINPENIESISVLKGPNAAALYGSRAANGAIIITTRSGRNAVGGQITASTLTTFETPLRLPRYQNVYGQGLQGRFSFFDGDGGGVFDFYDESWGPPMDGRLIPQYYSPIDPATGQRVATPFVPNPNNIRDFFDLGVSNTTSASFAAAGDNSNVRLSLSRMGVNGIIPGHELERISAGLSAGVQVIDPLRIETSIQLVNNSGNQRPGVGYDSSNPMQQFVWWGRQIDINDLRARYAERRPDGDPQAGRPYAWNYRYFVNPFYAQFENTNTDDRNRIIGNVSATYAVNPWLNAIVRSGTDLFRDDRRFTYAPDQWGMRGVDVRLQGTTAARAIGPTGAFGEWGIHYQQTGHEFLLSANPQLDLPFSVNATVGASRRDQERRQDLLWVPSLAVPHVYSVTNAQGTPDNFTEIERRRQNSLLGTAEFGYNNLFFLTFTGRNDWSSTLPEENRSYFYPSVSGSLIFSDLIPNVQDTPLDYGKLRASWTRVGADTDPYRLRTTFVARNPFDGLPTFSVPNQLNNPNLRPEETTGWEFGTELGFLNGRLGLDLTYYNAITRDQIFPITVSRATGYTGLFVNAGSVRNSGIETLVSVVPVQTRDLRWESSFNWTRNTNMVEELMPGVDGVRIGADPWGVEVFARVGEPYGQLMGRTVLRNREGQVVVNSVGVPALGPIDVIGNYSPDWNGGWLNNLSFRNFNLSVLVDRQQGGNLFSVSQMFGQYAGVLEETIPGRCTRPTWPAVQGMPVCNAETGVVVPGVKIVSVTGTDTVFAPNDIWTTAQEYHRGIYGRHEMFILDATYTKLREMTLGYRVPADVARRLRMSGLDVSLVGRNLYLWAKNPHLDPETAFDASNAQGLEFGQLPTPRSVGFNITFRP
jgi:TonB-linked SusC/RagA family outer membrane protein